MTSLLLRKRCPNRTPPLSAPLSAANLPLTYIFAKNLRFTGYILSKWYNKGTIEEGRDMSEWEEDLLALFDSLDEAARAEALAAALKIIGGEIL